MAERVVEEFRMETEFGRYASGRAHGVEIELELTDEALIVQGKQGSGYGREQVSSCVPTAVVVELLRSAGWTVEPPR